jgi:hypothetical protein
MWSQKMDSLLLSLLESSADWRYVAYAVVIVSFVSWFLPKRSAVTLPPGPRGLPLVGNLYDMPRRDQPQWSFWLKHKDIYGIDSLMPFSIVHERVLREIAGPISSVSALGRTVVIVNDLKLARELLEEKSKLTASRPSMPFAGDM